MGRRHACFITCVLAFLAGLASCSKEPATTSRPTAAAPAWPEGDVLRVTLPPRDGRPVPLEQRIHRDEAIEWIRRDRDGRIERWLQNADGALRHRDGDGRETPAPPLATAMRGRDTPVRLTDLLAPFAGIGAAHASPGSRADRDPGNANGGGTNSGSNGGSNSSGNSASANSASNGGANSSGNGASANSGSDGGVNSSGNGGSANSGSNGGVNSSGSDGGANSASNGGANSSGSDGSANSGSNGGANSSGSDGGANSGSDGDANSSGNGGGANSGSNGGANSSGNGSGANSGSDGGANSSGSDGGANSGSNGGANSSGNGGSANSGSNGGANSSGDGGGANSGSDGAANSGAGSAPVPPAAGGGSGMGDPHYVSADGALVSTQKAGEFWAMDSTRGLRLQTRQEPWHGSRQVAGITAIAAGVGARRLGIYVLPQARVLLDGQPLDTGSAAFRQVDLDGGGAVGVWSKHGLPSEAAVVWPDGSHVFAHLRDGWIDFRYRIAGDADIAGQRGLLGSADGDADNDRTARDGTIARTDDALDAFLESWRIRADESLFDYADGTGTDTYQRLDFPHAAAAPDAAALQAAAARCRDAGVTDAALQGACAFDLAVTGDEALLASHQAAQAQMQSRPRAVAHPASGLAPDIAHAQAITDEEWQRVTLDAGRSRTFAVDLAQNAKLVAHPESMECVDDWDGMGAGWQWFDAQGRARSIARRACADLDGDEVGAGRYYIVVVAARDGGPASFSFRPYIVQ